jgi:hypothetical protein
MIATSPTNATAGLHSPQSDGSGLLRADHQLINQTSGKVEYYTPQEIIEAARIVLGQIDLDPASSDQANLRVRANKYYTAADDGLSREWNGRVWMNHPFGRGLNEKWITKLEREYAAGRCVEACCICFAATSEKWYRPLLLRPQAYLHGRTGYLLPTGEKLRGCTKGSVVTYYGQNVERFSAAFGVLATVKTAYTPNISLRVFHVAQVEDEAEDCTHDEHDHGICLACGEDITDTLVGKAEAAYEGDR